MPTIGVLALQGDFAEHIEALKKCGAQAFPLRYLSEFSVIDGLIIPGGESTSVAKLAGEQGNAICDAITDKVSRGMPVYGTCMGAIFLAKEIEGSTQKRLGLMDIKVRRNAFGSQKESHERMLNIPVIGPEPFSAVFIRAPLIVSCGSSVKVLCQVEQGAAMVSEGNMLASIFHPEITDDLRIHQYFVSMVERAKFTLSSEQNVPAEKSLLPEY